MDYLEVKQILTDLERQSKQIEKLCAFCREHIGDAEKLKSGIDYLTDSIRTYYKCTEEVIGIIMERKCTVQDFCAASDTISDETIKWLSFCEQCNCLIEKCYNKYRMEVFIDEVEKYQNTAVELLDFLKQKCVEPIEEKLMGLHQQITAYKNGRFRNIPGGDEDRQNEFKKEFPSYDEYMRDYVAMVSKCDFIPLPPFVVFPTYSSTTLGWRMGIGEEYEHCWHNAVKRLSEEELQNYCSRFTYPKWWVNEELPARYQTMPWKTE